MKKVVFLIGMMVGFASTVFGQYDVVTVSSMDKFDLDVWYQVKGEPNEYYFFSSDDEDMLEYTIEYLEYMGGDIDKPSRIEEIDGITCYVYEGLTGDGTNSTVVVSNDDGLMIIYKVEY